MPNSRLEASSTSFDDAPIPRTWNGVEENDSVSRDISVRISICGIFGVNVISRACVEPGGSFPLYKI